MNASAYLNISETHRIAFHKVLPEPAKTSAPGVIFLGGFKSDMTGNKAVFLEGLARKHGFGCIRFDYRGHGQSSGRFEDHCISDWAEDAALVLERLTTGPQIVVGSSMGGWISLLLARRFPGRIAGLIGIAAAPDFTAETMPRRLTPEQTETLARTGQVALPSAYSSEPYVITRRLLEDGNRNLVLRTPFTLDCPMRLLHGTADPDVSPDLSRQLLDHVTCDDARLTLVRSADHRFSDDRALRLLGATVLELMEPA